MKFLERMVKKMEPTFSKGGKLEKLHPVYDGLATFLFTPGHATKKGAHIRDGIDLKRTMMTVIIALIPCTLFGMWNIGHQHYLATGEAAEFFDKFIYGLLKLLPLIIVSYGVGLAVEFIFCIIKGHAIQEGYLVSGLLIPLVMPIEVPLWQLAIACIFAVVIGKEVFGGTGMNIVNVALTARAFLFFAYPTMMSGNQVWVSAEHLSDGSFKYANTVDGFTGATALGDAASNMPMETFVEKYSVMESLIGTIPGSVGETSFIACMLGALILVLTGIGSLRIMLSMFAGGLLMGLILNAVGTNTLTLIPAHHQLLLGGFAFGAVFMATDPVTASQTPVGKIIYGFLAGILAILIRVVNPAFPEGVMMAILFMNICAPLIDHYVINANIKRRINRTKLKTA